MSRISSNLGTAFLGAMIALFFSNLIATQTGKNSSSDSIAIIPPVQATKATTMAIPMIDFTTVAERARPAVVHIKTKVYDRSGRKRNYATGSGVIITQNGYIITNKHVIDDFDEIEVILNDKRSFKGKVVGTDENTDLAVVKVNAKNLSYLDYGNSDKLKVGAWVMAVGNPFNLTSTATVGIVSAKARSLQVTGNTMSIESFIQTDAVVNSGNSGGALVNLRGELVGINSAIATNTGVYAGYSFAIPVNIVQKVVYDIIEYGTVQRGYLGVSVSEVTASLAKQLRLSTIEGVYVASVRDKGAAAEAGIAAGDVITNIAGESVNSAPKLQEIVGMYYPGDVIDITLKTENGKRITKVKLKKFFPAE